MPADDRTAEALTCGSARDTILPCFWENSLQEFVFEAGPGLLHLRRHRIVHALSLTLAVYMLLASGRALIPGMCATLAALRAGSSDESARPASCCSIAVPDAKGEPVWKGPVKPHPECAFCLLAKALIKSEAPMKIPGTPATPGAAIPSYYHSPDCLHLCAESRPRDPPPVTLL